MVTYYSDGDGRWWRTEWAPQCEEKILMGSQCQGTQGHDDVHWCYQPNGSYAWDDSGPDGGCGFTPPGHKSYRTPESMQELYHLEFKTTEEVTDETILASLEEGDTPEPGASTNRPLKPDDEGYDIAMERLEDYRDRNPDD